MSRAHGRVALIGFRGRVDVGASLAGVALSAHAVFRQSFEGFRAVVLGPAVVRELDPADVWPVLAPVRSRVLLCAEPSESHVVELSWVRCGFGEPAPLDELRERLAPFARRHVRPWLAFEEWLQRMPVPGSRAATAASAIFHLPKLRAAALARKLGWSDEVLAAVCAEAFALSPKQLLVRYVVASYRALRAAGATNAECAAALGYHDESALRRALLLAARADRLGVSPRENHLDTTGDSPVQGFRDAVS